MNMCAQYIHVHVNEFSHRDKLGNTKQLHVLEDSSIFSDKQKMCLCKDTDRLMTSIYSSVKTRPPSAA